MMSNSTTGNQWYLNDTALTGQTNALFIPTVSGDYFVIVTLNGCTSDTSNVITVTGVSVESLFINSGISVFPNPADDIVIVKIAPN
ncbi:MAG: hypothetical protein HY738_08625 [Bacteroidia bacterium]|nr:hypothetical protein [Bacteroidia bacterium]